MNKIERAIYDVKLFIKEKERQLLICQTEHKSLIHQLKTLKVIQAINLYDNLTDKQDIDIYDLDSDIENIVGTGNPNWYNLDNEVVDDLLVFLKSKINN